MGADLISYCMVLPPSKSRVSRLVVKESARISKALAKAKAVMPDDFAVAAEQLGVSGWDYENDTGEQNVEQLLKLVEEDLGLVRGFNGGLSSRDSGGGQFTINGKRVSFLYAGEPSWGDTPTGYGYLLLRALYRLGIGQKLNRMVE